MRIRSVRIQNFRGFEDETFNFSSHVCLLGANGVGKSTVLAALNIFFQTRSHSSDPTRLLAEDFHNGNTKEPIRITIAFSDLSERAKEELSHYVRHDELIATAEAVFDPDSRIAPVKHFGERLIYKKFAPFFEDAKKKEVRIDPLRERFWKVVQDLNDFPDVGGKPSKPKMIEILREYEESHPDKCSPEPSSDLFYGTTRGKHKLDPFIQWIYLPAVKEASEEAEEAGNTALGKLLQRTVRGQVDFDSALNELLQKTRQEFDDLLEKEQPVLASISERLAGRLSTYSHPGASLEIVWLQGSEKSVTINEPKATVKAQEIHFKGSLPHFGHGLQRSFLLAILQELALIEAAPDESEESNETSSPYSGPTLIFACEEPELYQHPPQARYLNNVLRDLSKSGNQVLLATHSPYFVSGEAFEEIRLIRKDAVSGKCTGHSANFETFSVRLAEITGDRLDQPKATQAKLHAALQPELSEMFFCNKVVLVEGMEDRAYITAALTFEGKWDEIRRTGLHIVPVGRKSAILRMLIIAQVLKIPAFVVFDADGDAGKQHISIHKQDNACLMKAMGINIEPFPSKALFGENHTIWPTNIGKQIKEDMGKDKWVELTNIAKQAFDPSVSLTKNPVFIAEVLREAWDQGHQPLSLVKLVGNLARFASG